MSESLSASRGRPRQPYCPDCKRAGKPFVKKAPGQGYCRDCHGVRIRRSYTARMQSQNPSYVPQADRSTILQRDIKDALTRGMELPVEMIQGLYEENGLPRPTEYEVRDIFFPVRINDPEDVDLDLLNRPETTSTRYD